MTKVEIVVLKGAVDRLPLLTPRVQPHPGFVGFPGALYQEFVLEVGVLHERLEGPGTEFFGLAEVEDTGGLVGFRGLEEQRAGSGAGRVQQNGLVTGLQALVEGCETGSSRVSHRVEPKAPLLPCSNSLSAM